MGRIEKASSKKMIVHLLSILVQFQAIELTGSPNNRHMRHKNVTDETSNYVRTKTFNFMLL